MDKEINFLKLNIYLSQGIILLIGSFSLWFFYIRKGILTWIDFFSFGDFFTLFGFGSGLAVLAIIFQIGLYKFIPYDKLGDEINRLFYRLSYIDLFISFLLGSFAEEILFRAVIQTGILVLLGNVFIAILGSSLFFSLLHIRYLNKPVLFIGVFILGIGLGSLYSFTASIWSSIYAHFLINFTMVIFGKKGMFVPQIDLEEKNL